ncbi:myb-like protein X isoform X2 [Vespa crabro]|uniref:myb-like protein X isoform X2 n=1 Tax=Vespa crabro TaxID=7445 RepID=UPI001F018669|nr:myb-like protein X isoform X2 [Vespa crabro]
MTTTWNAFQTNSTKAFCPEIVSFCGATVGHCNATSPMVAHMVAYIKISILYTSRMDLPATQICYDYDDMPTQKIEQPIGKEHNVQVAVLTVNSNSYPIYKGISKIGRHPDCNVIFNDQSISKYHAEIEINTSPVNAWICDLNSSNKTILNNIVLRPTRYYELRDNSTIEFGRIKAIYKTCRLENEFVIPETPLQYKQKKITSIIPESPDSLSNNSSIINGDDSTIATVPQECLGKSVCSRPSINQEKSQKVLKGKGKDNNVGTLSDSMQDVNNDESIVRQSSDKNKRKETFERDFNVSTCEQNDPSTSCESDDIFEVATQRIGIDLDLDSVKSLSPLKGRKTDDGDVDIDGGTTRNISNVRNISSTPIKKTNRVEELKKIENDIALATKCIQSREIESNKGENKVKNGNDIDDFDKLETQLVRLPDFINDAKERKSDAEGESDDIDDIDTLDTQIIDFSDSNRGANNARTCEKVDDIIDIDLLDTQPLSKVHEVGTSSSAAAKEVVQRLNSCNNVSIEDIDYETASTQIIEEMEILSNTQEDNRIKSTDKSKKSKVNLTDSLEQKLNDMFDEVNDEEINDTTMISTQCLENILEVSRCNNVSTFDKDLNKKLAESSRRTTSADSQDDEVYFGGLLSKRKRNVLADSQEILRSKVSTNNRRSSNRILAIEHVERDDSLNSFEISSSVTSKKKNVGERTETAKLSDDDILTRLPEVNISGTLSDPNARRSLVKETKSTRRTDNKKTVKKSDTSKVRETRSSINKNVPVTKLEDVNYENVKRMAEDFISNRDNKLNRSMVVGMAKRGKKVKNVKLTDKPSVKKITKLDKVERESESILTYVTDQVPPRRRNTRSVSLADSKKEIEERRTKDNNNRGNDNTSNTDLIMGEESQEVAMIMNVSSIIEPRNIRKRKVANLTNSDDDTLNGNNVISRKGKTNDALYEASKSQFKRIKFGRNNSSQLSVDYSMTDDSSLTVANEDDSAISSNVRSTRSTRSNTEKRKNDNNTSSSKKTEGKNDTWTDRENNRKTPTIPSTPATRRSVSFSSLNTSSFSAKEKILFTGIADDEYAKVLKILGGTKVEDPSKCTVLVTDKIRRTIKFLCALANAVPIVSVNWLHESKRAGHFLDWENYMLKDPAMEAKYGFRLRKSLDKARERKLLDGYVVLLTPNILSPPISELRTMITSCGGKALLRPSSRLTEKTIIISHQDDLDNARKLLLKVPKSVTIQSTEFLLIGILKQELDFVRHKLI